IVKLVKTSVKRPVGVIIIVLAIIALGIVSARNLVVDLFPKIDLPVAVVATTYEDAAPQEVENLISRPIESSISSVEGINTIQSQSQSGNSLVLMMFNNGVDLDQALLDVRERVDQAKGMLPDRAGDPRIMRFSPDQLPVVWVSLTGKDASQLTAIAEDEIVPFFERQEGVASVTVEGGKEREIQLILDEGKLQQHGINPQLIVESLNNQNQSASVGTVEKGDKDLQLRVAGEFGSIEAIEQTVLQSEEGATVRVQHGAEATVTFKPDDAITLVNGELTIRCDRISRFKRDAITLVNGEPSIVLSVMKKTDSNTVEVAN